ncbi:terminase small subunit [Azospirillum sp. Sh1]|nr:terminase small subunit [Azospirillum sp. Sh1]
MSGLAFDMVDRMGSEAQSVLVNKKELAKRLRCSLPTLDRVIERYPDFPIAQPGSNGRQYLFDAAVVVAYIREQQEREKAEAARRDTLLDQLVLPLVAADDQPDAPDGRLSPTQRLQLARAHREERKLASDAGLLTPTPRVQAALAETLGGLARFLDGLPQTLGRRYNLPEVVVTAMKRDLDEQRRQLVTDLKKKLQPEQTHGRPDTLV